MKIVGLSFCILLCFILLSCDKRGNKIAKKYDSELLNSLIKKGINDRDTIAYDRAFSYVFQNGGYVEFYYYALLMANKHNYNKAYYNLYILLTGDGITYNGIEIYSNNKEIQRQAIFYLLKSYELGYNGAHSNLEKIFGENIPKSSDYICENLNFGYPPLPHESFRVIK